MIVKIVSISVQFNYVHLICAYVLVVFIVDSDWRDVCCHYYADKNQKWKRISGGEQLQMTAIVINFYQNGTVMIQGKDRKAWADKDFEALVAEVNALNPVSASSTLATPRRTAPVSSPRTPPSPTLSADSLTPSQG